MVAPRENRFAIALTPSTADLIERYADLDETGCIRKFQIINRELIAALQEAKAWLEEGMLPNESPSEIWERENPCERCEERVGCTITCRLKHAFDKDVYGGILCGAEPVADQRGWGGDCEVKNRVRFRVFFGSISENAKGLVFERCGGYLPGAIRVGRGGVVSVCDKPLSLRPWSAALYTIFSRHPEGFPLSALAGERSKEFVRIYKTITDSALKVDKLKVQLADEKGLARLLNNRLSELNLQLKAEGVPEIFQITTTSHKANNKPYFIPYLREQK